MEQEPREEEKEGRTYNSNTVIRSKNDPKRTQNADRRIGTIAQDPTFSLLINILPEARLFYSHILLSGHSARASPQRGSVLTSKNPQETPLSARVFLFPLGRFHLLCSPLARPAAHFPLHRSIVPMVWVIKQTNQSQRNGRMGKTSVGSTQNPYQGGILRPKVCLCASDGLGIYPFRTNIRSIAQRGKDNYSTMNGEKPPTISLAHSRLLSRSYTHQRQDVPSVPSWAIKTNTQRRKLCFDGLLFLSLFVRRGGWVFPNRFFHCFPARRKSPTTAKLLVFSFRFILLLPFTRTTRKRVLVGWCASFSRSFLGCLADCQLFRGLTH